VLGPGAWAYCRATNNEDTGEVNCNAKQNKNMMHNTKAMLYKIN